MKSVVPRFAIVAILITYQTSAFAGARAEPLEEPRPDVWAKVANERAKGNAYRGTGQAGTRGLDDGESSCGSVDLGNVNTAGGGRGRAPRENTVVITGDVINANNRCR